TMFGFLYRATFGSALKFALGRIPASRVVKNCAAAAKLPLIHLGLAKDIWYDFDRYLEIEAGRPSTFYFIPFAAKPGRTLNGSAPESRGTGYCAADMAPKIQRLREAGCEIGLHGIDSWLDSESGQAEGDCICELSKLPPLSSSTMGTAHREASA